MMARSMMDTIGSQQLREYLEIFHRIYLENLKAYIPEEYQDDLLRVISLKTKKLIGYVSTIYGAGYEYRPGPPGEIEVLFGSTRIEEFIFECRRGFIADAAAVTICVQGPEVHLVSCGVFNSPPLVPPVKLDSPDASVTLANFEWHSRDKGVKKVEFAEMFADRSTDFWSREKAVERAMKEIVQAVVYARGMERQRTSLDDYLERFKERHVLILGDFSEVGRVRIEAIKAVLIRHGYYAFTLDDLKEIPELDLRQKLTAIASVCRFIVVDDSSRAGQAAEIPILESLRVVAVILRLRGSDSTFVNRPLSVTSKVIREVEYEPQTLKQVLDESIQWAEALLVDLRDRYANVYPWRSPQTAPQRIYR
jgi:hypothetical protein